jgi:hypothetical protein
VRVAYDVRKGNPLKKYSPADFVLGEGQIAFEPEPDNVQVTECEGNRVLLDVSDDDFSFSVKGFDTRRQLYVKAVAKEVTNGG